MILQKRLRRAWTLGLVALLGSAGCSDNDKAPVPPPSNFKDEAPPVAPSGLAAAKQHAVGFTVGWMGNTEPDLNGYRIYRYDPSPYRTNAYVLLNSDDLLKRALYDYTRESGEEIVYFKVTAIDLDNNESAASEPLVVGLPAANSLPTEDDPGANDGVSSPGDEVPNQPTGGPGKEPVTPHK